MDAFYASVELLRYPDLRGQPVVIGGGRQSIPQEVVDPATGTVTRRYRAARAYTGRGVITTATYAARKLGVGSAMGLMKAAKLAPDAVLLPADFDAYRADSRAFKAAVRAIAPTVEDRGIDEIYIDLTGVRLPGHEGERRGRRRRWWRARDIARALKDAVREATGLTCSIARRAEQAAREDRLGPRQARRPDDRSRGGRPGAIWPLPARRINGIGPKAAARLERLGIATIGELAYADRRKLEAVFGAGYARWMIDAANGRDDRPVVTESEPRSISRETTFERDLSRHARPRRAVARLHVAVRARRRRPRAQGLRGPHDRHQAALRRLLDDHARQDDRRGDAGRGRDPPRRRRMPEARPADAPPAAARRADRAPGAGRPATGDSA